MAHKAAFIFALALIQVIYSDAQLMDKEFFTQPYRPTCLSPCGDNGQKIPDFGFGGSPFIGYGCQQAYRPYIMPMDPIGGQPIGPQPPVGPPSPFGMSPPMEGLTGLGIIPPAGNPPQMQGPPANFLQSQNINDNHNKNFNYNTNIQ